MTGCGKCGQLHVPKLGGRPCHGHISTGPRVEGQPVNPRAGQPCTNPAMNGQDVCGVHGGRRAAAKRAGEQRVAEQRVLAAARKLIPDADQLTPISNPLARLLELAAEADAFRESLRRLANGLDRIRYDGAAGGEQLRAEVATYRAAMRDVTDLLIAIARLDIEKMLARVTVAQAEQSMAALRAGLEAAGLTDEQKREVMAGAGRHLRAVAS